MAIKKPLALYDGEVKQLQPGDNVSNPETIERVFTSLSVICQPVYADANGSVDLANASAEATSDAIGLAAEGVAAAASGAVLVDGVLPATTGEWDAVTGLVGGLVVDQKYWLDTSTGLLTDSTGLPAAVGEWVVEMGIALSTTEMLVRPRRRIGL